MALTGRPYPVGPNPRLLARLLHNSNPVSQSAFGNSLNLRTRLFWQRNFYEHIIRNETDLQNKTDYIEANPLLWDEDDENPVNVKK